MWRWVTRGLVLTLVAALLAPALVAQTFRFEGDLEFPDPGRVHSGLIFVKGWALDPGTISRIELWVDDQFQHEAVKFLPRIDIIEAYPDYPGIHVSRPGFITGFSANRFTNGPHTIEIQVTTQDGIVHFLGRRTININNSVNQAPFGFTDIPDAGGIHNAAGAFPVSGWAADLDGVDRIEVLVDGGIMQGAMYGDPRPDVGTTFPDFTGALFSGWVANVDTTRIQNGVHLLEVRAVDRNGLSAMIGRRQVQVINNDANLKPFGFLDEPARDTILYGTNCGGVDAPPILVSPPIRPTEHLTQVRGWALDLGTREDLGRVAYAELLVDGVQVVSTDDCGVVFGGLDNCYGLQRYDVQRFYPTYPDAPRAGFLFTLDIGALIRNGMRRGAHNLMVRVGDREQTFAELPNKDGIPVFFDCVDDSFDFPVLGFVEFPTTFDFVTGDILVRGWAVAEATTGGIAAIEIVVDGNFMGSAQYGFPRLDIRDAFPTISNARFSGWQFSLDTRKLSNARHRVTVRVVTSRGARREIGSVDFFVQNANPTP